MTSIEKFNRDIISAAIVKEQQREYADANRDFSKKLLRDGAADFLASMSDGSQFSLDDYSLKDIAMGLVNDSLSPLEVSLENGKLKQLFLTRNSHDPEFASVDFMLCKHDDGVQINDFSLRNQEVHGFYSRDLAERLFSYLSNKPHVELVHQSRTFNQDLLINARKPAMQLEKLLESGHEENIHFIANNIGCFTALKEKYGTKGWIKSRDVIMMFNDFTRRLLDHEGSITAHDLIQLHKWSEEGHIKHYQATGFVLSLLCKQFESRISVSEALNYQEMERMVDVMQKYSKDPALGFRELGYRFDSDVVSEMNGAFGLNTLGNGPRIIKNREWLDFCTDTLVMRKILDENPDLTGLDLVKMVAGDKVPLICIEHNNDRRSRASIYDLKSMNSFIDKIDEDVIGDDMLRGEAKTLATTSYELISLMKDRYDLNKAFAYYSRLLPTEKAEQISIFSELGVHSEARKVLGALVKATAYQSLLSEGNTSEFAAKKVGIDIKDTHHLKSVFPELSLIKHERALRNDDTTLG